MTRAAALVAAVVLLSAGAAGSQSLAVEAQQTVGLSSESAQGAGTQVRALGDLTNGLRLELEAAWGRRGGNGSDVFGTAYPYAGRVQVVEAYAEYSPRRHGAIQSVRAGRYRTPFGISAAAEHAYMGFLRPPLIRYGGYFALSNGYLEHGVDVVFGGPSLSAEVSVGRPGDVGTALRRPGITQVARLQASGRGFVAGASLIDTTPYLPAVFARGRSRFGGLDLRWMRGGVQARGEWLSGRPFDGTSTRGGYADLIVHPRFMGPVTGLLRAERLDYDTIAPYALYTSRYAAAARVRLATGLAASVSLVHQRGQVTQRRPTAVDVGLTYTLHRDD